MKNEIFVCKARVVFGQDVVFFRVFPFFVEKHEKQEGVGGRRRREKRCTFFLTSAVCKVNFGKKSTFFTIPGIPGEGLGISGYYARFCESHFSVVVRQRRKELMSRLFENSSNSLVESDIFRQEKDETRQIAVRVSD